MFDWTAVNWTAVIIAAVANVVIGTVWYLPGLFGRRWAAETGRDLTARPSPMLYVVAILGSLVTAYALALVFEIVMKARGPVSFLDGIVIGLVAAIGFQLASQAVRGAFEGRSWTSWAINAGNSLVGFAVMGAIYAAMV